MIFLMKFAEQVVQQVQQGATQQLNIIAEQVMNPIQGILQEVSDGAWRGVGADAFTDEVNNLEMPGINVITEQIHTFMGNLQRASEIITQADKQARQEVQGMVDVFSDIIKF